MLFSVSVIQRPIAQIPPTAIQITAFSHDLLDSLHHPLEGSVEDNHVQGSISPGRDIRLFFPALNRFDTGDAGLFAPRTIEIPSSSNHRDEVQRTVLNGVQKVCKQAQKPLLKWAGLTRMFALPVIALTSRRSPVLYSSLLPS